MDDRKMRMAAQLIQYLDQMDSDDLKSGMMPPPADDGMMDKPGADGMPMKGVSVEVAQVDPDKAKDFANGLENAGGLFGDSDGHKEMPKPEPVPPSGQNSNKGPMEKLMGDSAMNESEPTDEELEELEKMNA